MDRELDRRHFLAAAGGGLLGMGGFGGFSRIGRALHAQPAPSDEPALSVRDFGAAGDGATDDTEAFRAAFQAARGHRQDRQYPGSVYYASQPAVLIPPGVYRLSGPIEMQHYDRAIGLGNPRLEMADEEAETLHIERAYRNQVEGLCFAGGKRAIYINTANLDTCQQIVRNCQFLGSREFAVYTDDCASTIMTIEHCEFLNCMQVFRNTCDKATLADCWISTHPEMAGRAVIENQNLLHVERMLGVPRVNREADQRWIDNYGTVSCSQTRFGGEGAGFCAINNYAKYDADYPVNPNSIYLEDCQLYAIGNNARRAAIYCNEIPNMITVRNCHGIIDIPLVKVHEALDLDSYFNAAQNRRDCCRYLIQDNSVAEQWEVLPEQMRAWQTGLDPLKGDRPSGGFWQAGDVVVNEAPEPLAPLGWQCLETGVPGRWQDVGIASGFPSQPLPGSPDGDLAHTWTLPAPDPRGWSALVTVFSDAGADRLVWTGVLAQSTLAGEPTLSLTSLQSPGEDELRVEAALADEGAIRVSASHAPGAEATLRILQLG